MPRNKQSLAKRAATLALALCMVFTTAAQSLGAVAYADSMSTAISSSMSVDPGAPESAPEDLGTDTILKRERDFEKLTSKGPLFARTAGFFILATSVRCNPYIGCEPLL